MIRRHPAPGRGRRRGRGAPLLAALVLQATLGLVPAGGGLPGGGAAAWAAEFVVPPGQNVSQQEDLLRQRITRIAKDQIGDRLVSVVVHVGYVRVANPAESGGPERLKLPGLNNYITPDGGPVKVQPEFARLRQVVVMISNDLAPRASSLARDIRSQAELDESKGDWLQVVPVGSASPEGRLAALAGTRPEAAGLPGTAPPPSGPPVTPPPSAGVLQEPRSTEFLIRAREAYFRGDYNGALDQILQAINAKADNPQAYAMLGSLYYALNWKSLALKYWEKSLAQDPSNRELEGLVAQLRATQN